MPRALFFILILNSSGHNTNSVHRQKLRITEQRLGELERRTASGQLQQIDFEAVNCEV